MPARYIILKGSLERLSFRDAVREKALRLELKGTTRYLADESVEVFVEGPLKVLEEFEHWCRSQSVVEAAYIHTSSEKGLKDFCIGY